MKTPPPPFRAVYLLPGLNSPGLLDSNLKGVTFRAYEIAQRVKVIKLNLWSFLSGTATVQGENCFQFVSFKICLKLDYLI